MCVCVRSGAQSYRAYARTADRAFSSPGTAAQMLVIKLILYRFSKRWYGLNLDDDDWDCEHYKSSCSTGIFHLLYSILHLQ